MEEKKCSGCKALKPISSFNKHSTHRCGYQSQCRDCNKKTSRAYYQSNLIEHRKVVKARQRREVEANKARLLAHFKTHPCVDCGESDLRVLEFDHITGIKRNHVSRLLARGNCWSTIETEIAKCEVVCANCHRKRTFEREGSYRSIGRVKAVS